MQTSCSFVLTAYRLLLTSITERSEAELDDPPFDNYRRAIRSWQNHGQS